MTQRVKSDLLVESVRSTEQRPTLAHSDAPQSLFVLKPSGATNLLVSDFGVFQLARLLGELCFKLI